jgi:hypothetical protein
MSYRDRVDSPGPKKLLALDLGGIRGVITLEVLGRLESLLAEQLGAGDDFVLGDHFDYIGGTGSGALIAAGLAKGLRVEQLLDLYVTKSEEMFEHASLHRRYHYRYGSLRLRELFQGILGKNTTLGSEELKTLLLVERGIGLAASAMRVACAAMKLLLRSIKSPDNTEARCPAVVVGRRLQPLTGRGRRGHAANSERA